MAHDSIPSNGDLIRRRIKETGYTQQDFADLLHCEARTLRKWLQHGVTDLNVLWEIARIFDCDVRDLILVK